MATLIKIKKHSQVWALLCCCIISFPTLAIQPLADQHLAESVGEQSPVQINDIISPETAVIDEKLETVQIQVADFIEQQYSQPLQILIQMKEDRLHFKDDIAARKVHEISENSFGLEPFSYVWNGNFHQIVDLDLINNKSFSHETGQYELNNVQGRVTVMVGIY